MSEFYQPEDENDGGDVLPPHEPPSYDRDKNLPRATWR
jgi:hypothetical protein